MNPKIRLNNIDISQINFADFSYSISPEQDNTVDETLEKSIARYGILHPPMVRETEPGSYAIITGRKRLLAVRPHLTENTCSCLIIPRHTPEIDVFYILLEYIHLSRKLSPIEKAFFLKKITPFMDDRQIAKEFLPLMHLPPDPHYIRQSLMLLDLEAPLIRAIHLGLVSETVAHDFPSLSPQDRKMLFEIITSLRLSFSNQKKLLHICRELASRNNQDIKELLNNAEVHGILSHRQANPPQKTKNLMNWLSRQYMPRSREAEDEFKHFIGSMRLPQNVAVDHTQFFEDDSVTLSITFPNRESLENAWKQIRSAFNDKKN